MILWNSYVKTGVTGYSENLVHNASAASAASGSSGEMASQMTVPLSYNLDVYDYEPAKMPEVGWGAD